MYAFCQDMPGITVDQQATVNQFLGQEALTGCVIHIVGEIDGGLRMIDVWTDEAAYRTFQTQHLWPALDRIAADATATGQPPGHPGTFTVLEVNGDPRWGPAAQASALCARPE